jgi:hypothetical protein
MNRKIALTGRGKLTVNENDISHILSQVKTYADASTLRHGLMSATDKAHLDTLWGTDTGGLDPYGSGAYPYVDTVGPVGGGAGYVRILSWVLADYIVTSKAELLAALLAADGTAGKKYIYLAEGTTITLVNTDIPNAGLVAQNNIVLYSMRGYTTNVGAIIHLNSEYATAQTWPDFFKVADGVRITGIQIRGWETTATWAPEGADKKHMWTGLHCMGEHIEIDNCALKGFFYAGIVYEDGTNVTSGDQHHNNITYCACGEDGYGLNPSVYSTVTSTANIYDFCRHGISVGTDYTTTSEPTNLISLYDFFGAGCNYNASFDVHGGAGVPAGEDLACHAGGVVECGYATFAGILNHELVDVRGYPETSARFHRCWFYQDWSITDLIKQVVDEDPWTNGAYPWTNMTQDNNWIGVDPFPGGSTSLETWGTATVASGQTHIDVTHGLSATPTRVLVTPTLLSDVTHWWVTGKGATEFIINVDQDPGVGTATFDWCAKV